MSIVEKAASVCIAHGLPLALRGRPGVGKTSMIELVSQRLGLSCEVVVGSLREPTDFAGLPVIDDEGNVRLAPPAWAQRASIPSAGAVVLLDELTTASPAVQAAMLRVVRERTVGEITMPERVRIVAAYNDADDCGGYELELPMRSRLIHLNVRPDLDVFTAGITGLEHRPLAGRHPGPVGTFTPPTAVVEYGCRVPAQSSVPPRVPSTARFVGRLPHTSHMGDGRGGCGSV